MQTCATCRHWKEHGVFSASLFRSDDGAKRGDCEVDDDRFWALGVGRGAEGDGELITRADFGCVCHEPKAT